MRKRLLAEAELPLETAVLVIVGMTVLIAGLLLIPATAGVLPYYESGLYGLILFIFGLQTILMGKTPFGELPASRGLLGVGLFIASAGIVVCIIPSVPVRVVRAMLFVCLTPGGLLLMAQMILSPKKLRLWARVGGVLRPLPYSCTAVYLLSMILGSLLYMEQSACVHYLTAIVLTMQGGAVLYLARLLASVYREYPQSTGDSGGSGDLPFDKAMLLLMGVFLVLLGLLLFPVNLGIIPFAASAQIGLLMAVNAVQMLAAGGTPIGTFPRNGVMLLLGLLFAGAGIVSCIVPDLLTYPLTLLIGALNVANGVITLLKALPAMIKGAMNPLPEPIGPVLLRLYRTQTVMGGVSIMFGASMLLPGIISGLVISVVLTANGGVLLYLMRVLFQVEELARLAGETASSKEVS